VDTITVGIVCSSISALITFFVTTVAQRSIYEELSKKSTKHHIDYHHDGKSVHDFISEHTKACKAPAEIDRLKIGIVFLVGQMGGDPQKMGLL